MRAILIFVVLLSGCRVGDVEDLDAEADAPSNVNCDAEPGWTWCYPECIHTYADELNCGDCGVECPDGAECLTGMCLCDGYVLPCGGVCCADNERCEVSWCVQCVEEICGDGLDNDCDHSVDEECDY